MPKPVALLLTDLVDSAGTAQRLGDAEMGRLWAAHDRAARDLLRSWRGREIDKTDGFLLLFDEPGDALGYVLDYHRALRALNPPLKARAGLHVGALTLRETPQADVALGAKPLEADGISKPIAARVMSTARGGQTLLTQAALDALGPVPERTVSHGHWLVKGLPEPIELFEVGDESAPFTPPPDAEKVYRVVRHGDIWLPAREVRHNLPAERDAFVGRRANLQELARRFDQGARLVSVLGIGGCGKTRLATRYGWTWMGDYPGGVWVCDLAPARTVEGLFSAVAQSLDVPLGPEDPLAQLGHAIAGRGRCLLILDNFEQLSRHAEATLGRWLERVPQARFLVTTREVLGITGEEALALPPLPMADSEALFLRRAAAARDGFAPQGEDLAAVAALVKLLDGLPLGIELAAARVRTLAPRALLARMSERFRLLASSSGRQDRQATLRATFDWSWDLLSAAEKAALAQLSVFEGGFSLAAAEGVIDLSALPDAPWTLDVIHSLVDKSFVRHLGEERFDLLVSVQAYAEEHLRTPGRYAGSGAQAGTDAQLRHAQWFAEQGPQRGIDKACADLDNLVAACRRTVAFGKPELAARNLDKAWAALGLRGPFQAGVELSQLVCDLPGLAGQPAAQAHAVRGLALEAVGQRELAAAHFQQALAQAQAAADGASEALVLVRLAGLQARAGDAEAARRLHQQALQRARGIGNGTLECAALNGLGTLEFEQGQVEAARSQYENALAVAERVADRQWQGYLQLNLGSLFLTMGRLEQAAWHFEAALKNAHELGDRKREGVTLCNRGMLMVLQGDLAGAEVALQGALGTARDLGHVRLEGTVLMNLGLLDIERLQHGDAMARFEAAIELARRAGDRRMEGLNLGHLGRTHARSARFSAARACLSDALAIIDAIGDVATLGLLHCYRAECDWLCGDRGAARLGLLKAQGLAEACQAGPASELGSALAKLRELIASEPAALSRS